MADDPNIYGGSDFVKQEAEKYQQKLMGQGQYRDTGRQSSGYGESLDSVIGAPARVAIQEAQRGNLSWDAVKRIFRQIGADPEHAPTGYDIASTVTDDPWLGTFLATAVDFGAQLPGIPHLSPGVIGEVRGVKSMGKVADAVEAFAQRGKTPMSPEAKIAQAHGQLGEVRDAMPELVARGEYAHNQAQSTGVDLSKLKINEKSAYDNPMNQPPKPMEPLVQEAPVIEQAPQKVFEPSGKYQVEGDNVLKPQGEHEMLGVDAKKIKDERWQKERAETQKKRDEEWEVKKQMREKGRTQRAQDLTEQIKAIEESEYDFHFHDNGGDYEGNLRENLNLSDLGRNIQPLVDDAIAAGVPQEKITALLNKHSEFTTNTSHYLDPDHVGYSSPGEIEIQHDLDLKGLTPEEKEFLSWESGARDVSDRSTWTYYPMDDVVHTLVTDPDKIEKALSRLMKKPGGKGPKGKANLKPVKFAHGGIVGYAKGGMIAPSMPQHMPMLSEAEVDRYLGLGQGSGGGASSSFDMPSDQEVDEYLRGKNNERFDNTLGYAASAVTGALDSATLGLSNVALTKSGLMKPETLQALKDNALSYGAGEIGGMFAPSGAAGLVGKAGKATYGGLKALQVMKDAEKVGGAAKHLANIGAFAAGSAVEGALFAGVQGSLNEYALGDPDLNAEKILSNFGHGALIGGALGSVLKTAAIGAPPALSAAKDAIKGLKDKIAGAGRGEESLISKGLQSIDKSGRLSEQFSNRMKSLEFDQSKQDEMIESVTGGLNTTKKNLSTAVKDLNSSIRPAERSALIETANNAKVLTATQDILNSVNRATEFMKANSGEYSQNAVAKLERWRTQIANNLKKKESGSRFDLIKDFKQDLDRWGKGFQSETKIETKKVIDGLTGQAREILHNPDIFGMAGASEAAHNELLSQLYDFIPPSISKARSPMQKEFHKTFLNGSGDFDPGKIKRFLKKSGTPEGERAGELLDSWFELQQKLPEHLENTYANVPNDLWDEAKLGDMMKSLGNTQGDVGLAQTQFQEAIANSKGRNLGLRDLLLGGVAASNPAVGGLLFAADVASRPIEYINKLAEIERVLGAAAQGLERSAKGVFKPTLRATGKLKGFLSKEFMPLDKEEFERHSNDLSQMNNNPEFLIDQLHNTTKHLADVAPFMAEGLQASIVRANQFLQSKMPNVYSPDPFSPQFDVSSSEIAKYNNYRKLVDDPNIAFDQIRSGTVGPETVETLSIVYPRLYEDMKRALMEQVTNQIAKKEEVPYSIKQSVSFFLGVPLDKSLSPEGVLANQMAMLKNQMEQQPQGQRPSKTGMQKMTVAQRTDPQRDRET